MTRIRCFLLTPDGTVGSGLHVYRAPDGRRYHLGHSMVVDTDAGEIHPAPVGAMWDADWFRGCHEPTGLVYDRNPDGIVLCVRCPGGDWLVDGPSEGGGSWARTGTVPDVTVVPSIVQGSRYHGWLRDGFLEEC